MVMGGEGGGGGGAWGWVWGKGRKTDKKLSDLCLLA